MPHPRVTGNYLHAGTQAVELNTPAWYAWLAEDGTRAFTYETAQGSLSARREQQRNGTYWYAYRRVAGHLHKAYLGRTNDLCQARLDAALAQLDVAAQRRAQQLAPTATTATPTEPQPTAPDLRQPAAQLQPDALAHLPAQPAPNSATPPPDALLATKISPPQLRNGALARQHLTVRLQVAATPLTLISAPAGAGKTTLATTWLSSTTAYSWVSLDAADNEPARFWQAVFASLAALHPAVWDDAHAYAQRNALASNAAADLLARGSAASAAPTRLVLDDYHLIDHPAIHDAFVRLLEQPPSQFFLVLLTRSDPPFPLARLRARGQLTELRASDLRFTISETAAFVHTALNHAVPDSAIAALNTRTEGWAAGVQLATLALRTITERHAAADRTAALEHWISAFRGNHHAITDYLADEVLADLPDAMHTFLLRTAILEQLDAAVCSALCDVSVTDAQTLLERIERANLFLTPLDEERRWYRYHHLFRDVLRARLERFDPALVSELHRRAAAHYRTQQQWMLAIEHGFSGGDFAWVADTIEVGSDQVIWQQGDIHMITRWVERLPATLVQQRPALLINAAWAALAAVKREATERLLNAAIHAVEAISDHIDDATLQALRGEMYGIQAFLARINGNVDASLALSHQALAHVPPHRATTRGLIRNNIHAINYMTGNVAAMEALYQHCMQTNDDAEISVLNRTTMLHAVLMERGQLHEAEALMRDVVTQGVRNPHATQATQKQSMLWIRFGAGQNSLASAAYEQDRLEEAESYAHRAIELGRNWWNNDILFDGYLMLLDIAYARKQFVHAEQLEATLWQLTSEYGFAFVEWQIRALRADFALRRGNIAAALAWEAQCGLTAADNVHAMKFSQYRTLTYVLLATKRVDAARELATRLLHTAQIGQSVPRQIAALVACSLSCDALHQRNQALTYLTEALTLAHPGGYIRTFLDHGEPITQLLAAIASRSEPVSEYAQKLLHHVSATHNLHAASDALTARETEILHLLALGKTAGAIATTLIIAPSTVQTHIKHVYRKLAASNRVQALEQARKRGLLL